MILLQTFLKNDKHFCFINRSSIIEKFEKAKEKYSYYKNSIPPDTTMETLQSRWRSLKTIEAIQSVPRVENVIDDQADKLASSNA